MRPRVLVFAVHFFVPAGVGHVKDEWSEVKIDGNKESTDVAYIYISKKNGDTRRSLDLFVKA